MDNLRIDGDRLWASLMEMARIGATPKGGVCRLALTDLDRQGRDLLIAWAKAIGCTATVDRVGNVFVRREGKRPDLPAVATGSHLDTQPTGGRFDGVYGVLAGLEVLRTLHDARIETDRALEVVVWTNEEGSRFSPAMMGSGAYAGVFPLDEVEGKTDVDGKRFDAELAAIGYRGEAPVGGRNIGAYFEAHIEQGPILEAEAKTIGVVTGAQGQRWYEITVVGQEAHAGPTPMKRRKDALVGAARMIDAVNRIGLDHQPSACATVGFLQNFPNSRNTIPGRVFFTVDFRHPDDARLSSMDRALKAACAEIAAAAGLDVEIKDFWYFPPTPFAPHLVDRVREGAKAFGYPAMEIVSGAGHDAVYMARVCPTAMIFVPCADGISHNEIEDAKPADLTAGCNVLLRAMLEASRA
ncbi:MAG: Zn-dependent hydrolase [Azospirillum sp.]|nr:Zn-dependent hydrolase [Azospirillum sp.]MCZ8124168.1 Zn-dependent hydrolase [Magnetospirillum sp.]